MNRKEPVHIISLGAGVQSSTMALMAAHGEIEPMPAFAVFADTQDEPEKVYEWLKWLTAALPFPVYTTTLSKLSDDLFKWGQSQIPAFTAAGGLGKRQCTKHWKIVPVNREIRARTGTKGQRLPDGFACVWKGISTNEVHRAKTDRERWITARFPLLELRMNRHDCKQWMAKNGYPEPPRSACVFCPYHNNREWAELKRDPVEWAKVRAVEDRLMERGEFLHPSAQPLDEVDFGDTGQLDLFNNECEGMCGV